MTSKGEFAAARKYAAIGLLAVVTLVYWNSLRAPFLFDDTGAVLNNPSIRRLDSLAVLNPPTDGSTTTGRPVINLSYGLNYALSGENVWSYHAANVAIHALAALALMGIVRRTLNRPVMRGRFGSASALLAFAAALLWALHPLQTESVVGIAQRTESLCGLFYFLTLYGFIRGTEIAGRISDAPSAQTSRAHDLPHPPSPRWIWLSLSVVTCLAGMGTKEVMVTAPIVVLLYDRTFGAGGFFAVWRRHRSYYVALASTWLLLAWLVGRSGGARGASAGFGLGISPWTYLLKQCEAILLYLKLVVWPHPLVLDYGTQVVSSVAAVWWQGSTLILLLAATLWALRRKPIIGFCGATFFLLLAPSSSFVPLVTQTIAEHRMYLALAPVTVLLVLTSYVRLGARTTWLLAPTALLLAGVTIARNHDYRDAVTIWSDNVAKNPDGARGHNNLAWALQQQGKADAANAQFARAIALQPDYASAQYNWGVALLDQGRVDDAIAHFETVVRLAPDHADALVNLGNALMRAQRTAEAIPRYEAALRLNPAADAYFDLAVAFADAGRDADAVGALQAALKLKPDLADAHYRLGALAEKTGQMADAEHHYEETLRLSPDHAGAHRKLGLLLARSERLTAAAAHFRALITLLPADADAHANLGNVLLLQGQPREAIACYEESLRLRPNDARTRENLRAAREALR